MELKFIDIPLSKGEFIESKVVKDSIFIHHTAGSHRPDWVVKYWDRDRISIGNKKKKRRIAAAFVIGGKSIKDGNRDWDGKIVRAFNEEYWAFHLGIKRKKYNVKLDPKSIAIEICNYGYLYKGKDGNFYNFVNELVPKEDVYELKEPFRGYRYWHKYTDAQLESLRKLILYLSDKFEINVKYGINEILNRERKEIPKNILNDTKKLQQWLNENNYLGSNLKKLVVDGIFGINTKGAYDKATKQPFDLQDSALKGQPGLWTHANVRSDKFDCHPQPELLDMIKSL